MSQCGYTRFTVVFNTKSINYTKQLNFFGKRYNNKIVNKTLTLFLVGVAIIAGAAIISLQATNPKFSIFQNKTLPQEVNTLIQQETTKEIVPTNSVPLPTGEDIIRAFFALIQEKKISEAVLMMSAKNVTDDSTKQAWGVQFNTITSVLVKSVEPVMQSDWNDSFQEFKVFLDVVMSSDSASAPIPYYGFDNGENVRFIPLVKEGEKWKVDGLSTGP